jgi:hypothetical protein
VQNLLQCSRSPASLQPPPFRKGIELRTLLVPRVLPFGAYPTLALQPTEHGVYRVGRDKPLNNSALVNLGRVGLSSNRAWSESHADAKTLNAPKRRSQLSVSAPPACSRRAGGVSPRVRL